MPGAESQGISPAGRAASRLAWALLLSAGLHLALIYGVRVDPGQAGRPVPAPIEARLVELRPPTDRPPKPVEAPTEPARTAVSPKPPPAAGPVSRLPSLELPLPDQTYYPAKQLDVHAIPLQPINPQYPPAAAGISGGEVTLLLLIDEFGKVREVSVLDANPRGYFEQSAVDAFRDARFAPAVKDGRQVRSRMVVRVSYGAPPPTIVVPPR